MNTAATLLARALVGGVFRADRAVTRLDRAANGWFDRVREEADLALLATVIHAASRFRKGAS